MIHVVAAYLTRRDSFLTCQRAYGELKGLWEFPGGKVNPGEELFDAIKREMMEELGLHITPQKVIRSFTHTYPFATIHLTLIHCMMNDETQQIKTDGSHSQVAWTTLSNNKRSFAPLDQTIFEYLSTFHS